MKKWELIAEAHQRFPLNKFIKPIFGGKPVKSTGKFEIAGDFVVMRTENEDFVFLTVYNMIQWATIVTEPAKIAVKVESEREFKRDPLLISEDGVELFDGDNFYVLKKTDHKWSFSTWDYSNKIFTITHNTPHQTDIEKYFSTEEAAMQWKIKANRTEIQLDQDTKATISKEKDCVVLEQDGKSVRLSLDLVSKLAEACN